ncbi:unnamed protein product [Rotaria socialis]|uniref:Uncharacterized protein n=1 Tax=Rotaria socialis TaxID=392032 RepID=A0A821B9K6_9BILA|nr:unnamed protein product [Rotaria socialis]
MILYDRMFCPYVRRLANKTVVVEKRKLNLLGLSTAELMETLVSRLKSDYDYRQDGLLSCLLGKSVQHAHRFAPFIQTLEYRFDLCVKYSDRFERFPSSGKTGHDFVEHIEGIFQESFHEQTRVDKQLRQFFISDQLVVRAIDLVSGLLQQIKILLDDTIAPIWAASQARPLIVLPINDDRSFDTEKHEKKKKKKILVSHYVSTEKLQRIAMEILLFPSICFTVTQLHMNSLLHNAASSEIRCVLEHLMKCDLLECCYVFFSLTLLNSVISETAT